MNTAPPWSRLLSTQPQRVASEPTSDLRSWPQVWERSKADALGSRDSGLSISSGAGGHCRRSSILCNFSKVESGPPRGLCGCPRGHFLLHEAQRIAGQRDFILVHPPPNFGRGCDFRQRQTKRLDDHPTVVADVGDAVEGLLPIDATLPRGAAIVLTDVHVVELFRAAAERRANALLFDVGVEGVVHHAAGRMVHFADKLGRIRSAVEKVGFEAVEPF